MKKTTSTELTSSNIASILDLLANVPKKLEALSKPLSAEQLRSPLGSGERSFTEDVAHMLHVEAQSSEMIYQAVLTDEPFFAEVHPERDLGKLLRFDLLNFSELLAYYKTRRKVLLRVLSGLSKAQWSRSIREEGKKRKESVYWRARTIVMHELDHLSDLETKTK